MYIYMTKGIGAATWGPNPWGGWRDGGRDHIHIYIYIYESPDSGSLAPPQWYGPPSSRSREHGTREHTYMHACMHTYIHTYTHRHTYLSTYLPTYIPTYLHTYLRTYVPTYIPTYLPTYLHTYIHTNQHTYQHTNIPTYHHHRPQGGDQKNHTTTTGHRGGPEEPYHHPRPQGGGLGHIYRYIHMHIIYVCMPAVRLVWGKQRTHIVMLDYLIYLGFISVYIDLLDIYIFNRRWRVPPATWLPGERVQGVWSIESLDIIIQTYTDIYILLTPRYLHIFTTMHWCPWLRGVGFHMFVTDNQLGARNSPRLLH